MIKKYENWNPPLSEKAIKRRGGYKNRSNSRQWAHWWQNRKETRESPRYSRKIGDGGLFQTQVAPLHSTLGSSLAVVVFFLLSSLGVFNDAKLHRAPRGFFFFVPFRPPLLFSFPFGAENHLGHMSKHFARLVEFRQYSALPELEMFTAPFIVIFLEWGCREFFFLPPFSSCSTRNGFLMTGRLLRACGFFSLLHIFVERKRQKKRVETAPVAP